MAWTKSEAEQYMSGKTFDEVNSSESSQTVEEKTTSPVDNVESTVAETTNAETSNDDVKPVEEEENSTGSDVIDNPEKVDSKTENKKGSKYSPEEKQKHAFAKEKNKRKEVQAKLNSTLKEIEELKAKLSKYEGLTRENFQGNEDAYQDYRLDQRFDQEKVNRLQQEYDAESLRIKQEEANEIANERLVNCYPDEAEQQKYQNLVYRAETAFNQLHPELGYEKFSDFLLSEEDKTVLGYLQDSDNSPKLIKHFIMKPEAAQRIMSMRNPYNKIVELKQLENRMLQHERVMASKNRTVMATPVKKEIPNTGKVINNTTINNGVDYTRPWSRKDAENYIANHK